LESPIPTLSLKLN